VTTAQLAARVQRYALPLTLVATLLIGGIDYLTDVTVTLVQLAYIAPIVMGTWLAGRRLGILLAVLATLCASVSQLGARFGWHLAGRVIPWPERYTFNAIGCCGVLVIIAVLSDRLRHHVEREQLQRRAAVDQLRHAERLNVIGVLAAGVAHELGTPLNVIAGTAELLDADPTDLDGVRRGAATIIRQTEKISAIITHLLAFGRRGTGTTDVVDLGRVAGAASELLGSTARRYHTAIELVPAEAPVRVRAADSQVEQVISNLVLNAIQAMPGGGTVYVRTGITTRRDADAIAREFGSVTVEDKGAGIAPRDLARIFDPFFTTKGVGEGTGLGLSVSYGIVRDHGGAIEVASELGHGTRFTVLLPLEGSDA